MKTSKQIKVLGLEKKVLKGGENRKMKIISKLCMVGLTMLISTGSVFAIGGILSDGNGTNHVYGTINGRNEILRNITLTDVDGAGVTNIPSGGIVSLDAAKLTGAIGAIDLGSGTNVPGANITGTVPAARLGANLEKLAGNDGGSLTNVTAAAPADMLSTNDTAQSKAGLLTLNGGVTVGGNAVFTPSSVQSIAMDAAVAANAAIVQVASTGGVVTATMANGTTVGQVLKVLGTSDTDTVTLTNAAVVPTFKLGANDAIQFVWNGAWVEEYRRDN